MILKAESDIQTPRIVAIDYGTKRVGLAITDPLRLFAQPVGAFSPDSALFELRRIQAEHGIERIVIGWPLMPDGTEGRATELVQEYVNRLKKAFPGVPISKFDERSSSRRAMAALVEAGVKRVARGQKERIDAAAAAVILQDFLDEPGDVL